MNDLRLRELELRIEAGGMGRAPLIAEAIRLQERTTAHSSPDTRRHPGGSRRNFARHYIEMVAAMVVGMVALGGLVSLVLWLLGRGDVMGYLPVRTLVMATNMSVGMGLWMRHRGHAWSRIAEMSAAMYAPFLVLLAPYAAGKIGAGPVMGAGHLLMLTAMLAVMLPRYNEYSQDHGAHCPSAAGQHPELHHQDEPAVR